MLCLKRLFIIKQVDSIAGCEMHNSRKLGDR